LIAKLTIHVLVTAATQAASGLADFHNIDKEGVASIAHTDISPSQFIQVNGIYKLNDFNRARFLRWNSKKNEPCGYLVEKNPGRNRSPEEYMHNSQSEKVCLANSALFFYLCCLGSFFPLSCQVWLTVLSVMLLL
jgi:hypothetical protein